jgi:hypothetical protein
MPRPAGSVFSAVLGFGNINVSAPGNFDWTVGIVTGIELALGGSLLEGEGVRELAALFAEGGESSRRAKCPPFSFLSWGEETEELTSVEGVGLSECSCTSVVVATGDEGIGICSIVVGEVDVGDIDRLGGFRFLFIVVPSDSDPDEAEDMLVLLSWRCPLGRFEFDVLGRD